MIKKMLVVLSSANILRHNATVGTKDTDSTSTPVSIKDVLDHLRSSAVGDMIPYALFDEHYWYCVKVLYSTGV